MRFCVIVFLSVCTCVVHKRCHQNAVTKCPGIRSVTENEGSAVSSLHLQILRFLSSFFMKFMILSDVDFRPENHLKLFSSWHLSFVV